MHSFTPSLDPAIAEQIGKMEARLNERMTALEGRVNGAVSAIQDRFQKGSEFWTETRRDVDKLQVGNTEREARMVAQGVRVAHLETSMDDLPARTTELEKYGSKSMQAFPAQMAAIENRLIVLETKPKELAEEETKRQSRILKWAAVGGCLYMVISTLAFILFSALGIGISFYLAHH